MYVETMNTGSFSLGTRLCGSYTVEYTLRAELIYSVHLHIFSWPFGYGMGTFSFTYWHSKLLHPNKVAYTVKLDVQRFLWIVARGAYFTS